MVQNRALINSVSHLEKDEKELRERLGISRPSSVDINWYFPSRFTVGEGGGQLGVLQGIIINEKMVSLKEIAAYLEFLRSGGEKGRCDDDEELTMDERKEKATEALERCMDKTSLPIDEFFAECEEQCTQLLSEYEELSDLIRILLRGSSCSA